ncbi:tRNA (guanosine(46)-N7)-methyltransferase TrmB [Alkalibacter mobilis]|uniref:tRNA (guanosine(46)-N7)-methyltransferase TrmB n=1 Tax=Alkalibacter mobilis TaxID=2787712 RepID=UPI0018A0886F|nr:tRNA (guanosine(46)-N7)-methyltransferase TrmB [Alkalibacter mobilis]MBF7097391.1 tRNA (guanosine(46)-N7)-methyltransferase TrmB [Alkalibacter mobilis]
MRLRKKPWAEPEMRLDNKVIFTPSDLKGKWKNEFGNSNPICLEIGSGKGKFITELALANPDVNYIALDYQNEVLVYMLRKANSMELNNLRIIPSKADFIDEYFDANEITKIFINFCNPWPKTRHQKRRLTHSVFLQKYRKFLTNKGTLQLKTDDQGLFLDSLDYLKAEGFVDIKVIHDLYKEMIPDNITTEYEEKFHGQGIKIRYGLFENQT